MIYIQSYHSGVVGPVQVRKKIPARESLERPLVCMLCWLSASVVTTALSLTVLLVCFSLFSDSDMTSVRVDLYVCYSMSQIVLLLPLTRYCIRRAGHLSDLNARFVYLWF